MQEYSGVERPLIEGTLRGYREWQWGHMAIYPEDFPVYGEDFPVYGGDFLWPQNLVWSSTRPVNSAGDAPHHVSPWLSDTWNEAVCARLETHQVPYPDRECCGFYAKYRPQWNQIPRSVAVPGVIEAKGRIILGTKGFRAQQARIVALIKPETPYENNSIKAAETYGVPLFNSKEEALEVFPPHDVEELLPELREERERRAQFIEIYMELFEKGEMRFAGWPRRAASGPHLGAPVGETRLT